jgi:putative SOS response-associated peptidase YedK
MKEMKTMSFALFVGNDYTGGGMNDFVSRFETMEDAIEYAKKDTAADEDGWFQVVEISRFVIVASGGWEWKDSSKTINGKRIRTSKKVWKVKLAIIGY